MQTQKERQIATDEDLKFDEKIKNHARKQEFLDIFTNTVNKIIPFAIIFLALLAAFALLRFAWQDWPGFLKLFLEAAKYIGGFIVGLFVNKKINS